MLLARMAALGALGALGAHLAPFPPVPPSIGHAQAAVLASIDQARAREGFGPLVLPRDYGRLSVAEQLGVVTNAERTSRGLPGVAGLSAHWDAVAEVGARSYTDPGAPLSLTWGSVWAGGEPSVLAADFDWLYNDGPGGPNVDCVAQDAGGCGEHISVLLGDYGAHPALGVGVATVHGATSWAVLLVEVPAGALAWHLPRGTAKRSSAGGGPLTGRPWAPLPPFLGDDDQ